VRCVDGDFPRFLADVGAVAAAFNVLTAICCRQITPIAAAILLPVYTRNFS